MTPKQQARRDEVITQCVDLMRLRHMARNTEGSYLYHIGSYIDWLAEHGRDLADSRARMEAYLTAMANRGCSASGQNVAFSALKFLYTQVFREKIEGVDALRAQRPKFERQALPKELTLQLLQRVPDVKGYPTNLIAWLLYGCGLRLSEAINLRVKDLLFMDDLWLQIKAAKGNKDRKIRVPLQLVDALKQQLECARAVWQEDRAAKLPIQLPGLLATKYPNARFSWMWAFVFPKKRPVWCPRSKATVRIPLLPGYVQDAMRQAAREMELEGLATPHVLRHCWATHVIEAGAMIPDVQAHMGHQSPETTMGYVHEHTERVLSPLEAASQRQVIEVLPADIGPLPMRAAMRNNHHHTALHA